MKTALILVGAVALVLISMDSSASGSPAPNEAIKSLISDDLIDNKGLVRQKRGTGGWGSRCRSHSDCRRDYYCANRQGSNFQHCIPDPPCIPDLSYSC